MKKYQKGFTLVEMLIVLIIISVLSLLIIPNVASTKESVQEQGKYALNQLVETQIQLYEFEVGAAEGVTLEMLLDGQYITKKQFDEATKWGIPY